MGGLALRGLFTSVAPLAAGLGIAGRDRLRTALDPPAAIDAAGALLRRVLDGVGQVELDRVVEQEVAPAFAGVRRVSRGTAPRRRLPRSVVRGAIHEYLDEVLPAPFVYPVAVLGPE